MATLKCQWCKKRFRRPHARGPIPKFCSSSHRQRAFQANQARAFRTLQRKQAIAVVLPADLRKAVEQQARRRGLTYRQAVIQALEGWLNPSAYCDM